jgi:hypothetical protein
MPCAQGRVISAEEQSYVPCAYGRVFFTEESAAEGAEDYVFNVHISDLEKLWTLFNSFTFNHLPQVPSFNCA